MTSGFTAVTNRFLIDLLQETITFLKRGEIQMVNYLDFFQNGYKLKADKDVYHYLTKVAAGDSTQRRRGVCHRLVRKLVEEKYCLRKHAKVIIELSHTCVWP